eukprot:109458-Chlamydomonas_euryale.AAC.3
MPRRPTRCVPCSRMYSASWSPSSNVRRSARSPSASSSMLTIGPTERKYFAPHQPVDGVGANVNALRNGSSLICSTTTRGFFFEGASPAAAALPLPLQALGPTPCPLSRRAATHASASESLSEEAPARVPAAAAGGRPSDARIAAACASSCSRMRAILPLRPPHRPHASFASSALIRRSSAVALETVPSRFTLCPAEPAAPRPRLSAGSSSSDDESESEPELEPESDCDEEDEESVS